MAALPDYLDALASTLAGPWQTTPAESIDLHSAHGRVLAQAINADRDLPPFDRSAMDGYALRIQDLAANDTLPCAGFIAAGDAHAPEVPPGSCVGIATGAVVPPGLDAVAPHEWTNRDNPVRFDRTPEAGASIHHRSSDAKKGDELVAVGLPLGPVEIGLAATIGIVNIPVYRRPRVMLLSSGDEVVPIEDVPEAHQVRNSNMPMIDDLLVRMGAEVVEQRLLRDDPDLTLEVLKQAEADVIVTIGGISAGDRDAFREAIATLDATILLQGAAIQPGRPIQVTSISAAGQARPVVSLPGNPVSALVTACLFLWPLLRMLQGAEPTLPWTSGVLGGEAQRHHNRRRFRPATRDANGTLHVPDWQGSGDLAHAAGTIGLVDLAAGTASIPVGSAVRWLPWP